MEIVVLAPMALGAPLALFMPTRMRTGPKALSRLADGSRRQLCSRPTCETLKSREVLPIGVLQQLAYQRSMPLSLRDMQLSFSRPCVKVTCRGSVAITSDPP